MSLLFNKADKKKEKKKKGCFPKGLTMLKKSSRTIMHCSRQTGKMGETWEHRWVMNLQFHKGMTAFHYWISSQIQSLLDFSWWLLFPCDHHHHQQQQQLATQEKWASTSCGPHFLPEMCHRPALKVCFEEIAKLTPPPFTGLGFQADGRRRCYAFFLRWRADAIPWHPHSLQNELLPIRTTAAAVLCAVAHGLCKETHKNSPYLGSGSFISSNLCKTTQDWKFHLGIEIASFLVWFQKAPKSPMTSIFAAQAMKSYNIKK